MFVQEKNVPSHDALQRLIIEESVSLGGALLRRDGDVNPLIPRDCLWASTWSSW